MATTILDTLKSLGAATFDRLALLVGVVDDTPATYADGDVKPARIHKTNRGVYVHVANAEDISGGGGGGGEVTQGNGAAAKPWYFLGVNGGVGERIATEVTLGGIDAKLPSALIADRLPVHLGSWFGATTPTVGQKAASASIPFVWASDVGLPTGTNTIGKVQQAEGDAALPWYVEGVNAGTPERLATAQLQGAGLPNAFTAGGGVRVGLVDALPVGTNVIGKVEQAAASQVDGHSESIGATTDADTADTLIGRVKKLVSVLAGGLPAALVDGRLDANTGAWLGSTAPTVGQKLAASSIPAVLASDVGLPTGTNWIGKTRIGDGSNEPVFMNSAPVGTEYGMGVRVISMPTITATVSGVAQETTLSALSGKFATAATMSTGSGATPSTTQVYAWQIGYNTSALGGSNTPVILPATIYGSMVQGYVANGAAIGLTERGIVIAGKDVSGNKQQIATDTSGRPRVVQVRNLAADGTTDAPARKPSGGDTLASSSGVIAVDTSGNRAFVIDVYYTGTTKPHRSGEAVLWLQLHIAASATTPTTATLKMSFPMDTMRNQYHFDFAGMDLVFSTGFKLVASTTRLTTTIATTETFSAAKEGA